MTLQELKNSILQLATRLLVDDDNPSQKSFLLELVDSPVGVKAIVPA